MSCEHVYTLFSTAGRQYLACLLCLKPKPPEPCYFEAMGTRDRLRLEGKTYPSLNTSYPKENKLLSTPFAIGKSTACAPNR